MIHAFRGCELDEELFQLRRRGRVVKLEALVGEPPSPLLASTVHEMTEGNPFFIQEVVRLFAPEIPQETPQLASGLACGDARS